MHDVIWVVVAIIAVAIVIALVASFARKSSRKPFEVHPFPANYVEPYTRRIDEIEKMFVHQPREALAASKLLVDDMLTRMGYPVRMTNEERVKDLRHYSKPRSERYLTATTFKGEPTTEQMRRGLQAHLETARELLDDVRTRGTDEEPSSSRQLAG